MSIAQWKKGLRNALAVLVNLAFTTNQLLAQLPPPETFDSRVWIPYQTVGQGAQPGWQLSAGSAQVSGPIDGFNGGQALRLPVNLVVRKLQLVGTKSCRPIVYFCSEISDFARMTYIF